MYCFLHLERKLLNSYQSEKFYFQTLKRKKKHVTAARHNVSTCLVVLGTKKWKLGEAAELLIVEH